MYLAGVFRSGRCIEMTEQKLTVETVAVLESHIDHLTGEELGHAFAMLQGAGAVDVIWLPGVMKKNRPGGVFRAICMPDKVEEVQTAFFRHTHTLGIRRSFVERVILPREEMMVETVHGSLEAKCYEVEGTVYTRVEFEALVRAAAREETGLPAMRFVSKKSDF